MHRSDTHVLYDDLRLREKPPPLLIRFPQPLDLPPDRRENHGVLCEAGSRILHLVGKGLEGLARLQEHRVSIEELSPDLHLQGVMRRFKRSLLCLQGRGIVLRQD